MDKAGARFVAEAEHEEQAGYRPINHKVGPIEKYKGSIASTNTSEDGTDTMEGSLMEPFPLYKPKIERLLTSIGIADYSVDVIQHGYSCQNSVYRLTPISRDTKRKDQQHYILRVPTYPTFDQDGAVCQAIVNNVALTEYLSSRLPVPLPRVKVYSATTDNALEAPFTIQTRIAGTSLETIYAELEFEEKLDIIKQFVDILAELERIHFGSIGTFVASSPLPLKSNDFVPTAQDSPAPVIACFGTGEEDFVKDRHDHRGSDLKTLLSSHINSQIPKGPRVDPNDYVTALHRRTLAILESLDQLGAFGDASHPIVLHHTDLEPRNIMVSNSGPDGKWKISGIIDWDEAVAVPRPLARRPPNWIWTFDANDYTGYNVDRNPCSKENLSLEGQALNTYFDTVAKKKLGEEYLEDAYGHARRLRQIWDFVRGSVPIIYHTEIISNLETELDTMRKEQRPSTSSTTFAQRAVEWGLGLEREMRKRL